MADTRLNIQLSAQNAELNEALKSSTEELKDFNDALKDSAEASNNFVLKYYLVKEAAEQGLDVFRLLKSSIGELAVLAGEKVVTWLEYAEGIARTTVALTSFRDDLDKLEPTIRSNIGAMREYIETLKNDPFLQAANNAQQYEARLAGLSGSSRAAANELEHLYSIQGKASGGFSSDSLIEAGIALKGFRQNIEDTIPLAIKLAAGTGEPIEKAANTLGAAYSGIGTAFSSLQRTFHITRDEIKAAGAALDENGEIASRTTAEYEKTRAAMEKIINTKFGDVLEKKAETIGSAFQRVENAFNNIFEGLGEIYAKSVTQFLNNVGEFLEGAKSMIPVLKYVADNLYNFMTPITFTANALAKLGSVAGKTAKQLADGWNKVPQGLKDTAVMATAAASGFVKVGAAVSGMVAASLIFGGVYLALAKVAGVVAVLTSSVPILGTAFAGTAAMASAAAALSFKLAAGVAALFQTIGIVVGLVTGAWMVHKAGVKYASEEYKKFEDRVNKTVSSTATLRETVRGTTSEIIKTGASVDQLKMALQGYRAEIEQAEIQYKKLKDEHDGKWWIIESYAAKESSELKVAAAKSELARRKANLKEQQAAIKEAIEFQKKAEADGQLYGEKLYQKSKELEDRNLEFDKKKAMGKIQTKRQEADEINKIFEDSVKYRQNLEKDISVMEQIKAQDPENKNKANEVRLERFKSIMTNMLQIENQYKIERLAANREAYREDIALAKEEMDFKISIGKATNAEKMAMIKDFMSANADALSNDVNLQKQLNKEVISMAYEEFRRKKEIKMQMRQSERTATEDRIAELRYEDSIGKNRIRNFEEENQIIRNLTESQIKDLKVQQELQLKATADEDQRALIIKQTQDQINHLREQERVQLRENVQAHAEMTAQEIQDNIARINSRKSVLQAEMDLLQDKFGRGYNNEAEIRANREIQRQKEIDVIRSEEKARLEVEKNERKIRIIKTETADKIKNLNSQYALETARFEESVQQKLAERKLALNELVIKELETSRAKYEEEVNSGRESGIDALEKEAEFIKRNAELKIASIRFQRDMELAANKAPAEQAKVRREAANEEKKVQIESSRSLRDLRLKEVAATREAAEKELQEAQEVYEFKGNKSREIKQLAFQERQMVLEQLAARKATIEAQGEEAYNQASVTDKARVQRNTQLEINKAIRDSVASLQAINQKYSTGNSELDKIVKKYDKALANLRQMQGILDAYDDEPMPEPPSEEEIRNNPMAKSNYESKVKDQRRKVEELRKKKEKAEEKARRDEEAKAEAAVEAETVRKRRIELKAEGKTPQEINETIRQESIQRQKDKAEAAKNKKPGAASTNTGSGSSGTDTQNIPGVPVGELGKTEGQPAGGAVSGGRVEGLLTQIRDGINKLVGAATPQTVVGSATDTLSMAEKMSQIPEGLSSA